MVMHVLLRIDRRFVFADLLDEIHKRIVSASVRYQAVLIRLGLGVLRV